MTLINAEARAHQRLKQLLLTALDIPEPARAAWLSELRRSAGAETEQEVRRLLDAHARADAFLDVPDEGIGGGEDADVPAGRRIGPFVVERELGRGGMGAVYLAVRDDGGFAQRVALKVIASDADGRAAARLREERRILASLSHPFIAHFIDGGTTAEGLPFIAMEYVEGCRITAYCDDTGLDVPGRLRLFIMVCRAVDFAHQHLVVHRDIKPSNILVTDAGMPKLLDFGIAKLTEDGNNPVSTAAIMTPHYASPEQVLGGPMTTATDVYSLGVLLYELLAGSGPYRSVTARSAPLSVLDAVRAETPERPSIAARRAGGATIGSDLDAIVLKALAKSPADRYHSAGELSDDLARYLDGRPVLAQPPSRAYQARKFMARNRTAVAAGGVALVSLLAATGISSWQARVARVERTRAEARFEDVRQLARAVLFDLDEAVRVVPGTTAARRLLMSQGLAYLERLSRDVRDELPLQRELAAGYQRIGDVQGNPFMANLGERREAMTNYRRALAMREQIVRRPDAGAEDHVGLAQALTSVGDLLWADGDFDGAWAHYERAAATSRRLRDAEPASAARALAAARSAYQLGQALTKLGRFAEARRHYEASFQILDAGPSPADPTHRRVAAIASLKIGDCRLREGDLDGSRQQYARSAAGVARLLAEAPARADLTRLQAFVAHRQALVEAVSGRLDTARAQMLEVMATQERLAAADPRERQVQGDIASAASTLGGIELLRGRPSQAQQWLARALDRFATLAAAGAGYADLQSEHGATLRRRGDLDAARGDLASALQWYRQAMALLEREPRDQEYAPERVLLYFSAARVGRQLGERQGRGVLADADRWRTKGLEEWQRASTAGARVWMEAFGSPTALEDLVRAAGAP